MESDISMESDLFMESKMINFSGKIVSFHKIIFKE